MTRARKVVMVFLAASATLMAAAPRPAAAAPAPDEQLNDKGVELRRKGNDRAALEVFKKAYDMTHSPRATAQLGLVYQALGRWELAGPLVDKALQSPNDPWIKKYQVPLQEALTTIKQHLAHIDLTGEPAGAEVIVNGAPAGKLPLPGPLTVATGTVDLQVRAPGYQEDIRKVTLAPYQYEHVFVRLDKVPEVAEAKPVAPAAIVERPSAVEAPKPAPEAQAGGASARTVIKWSALGLGAAGVVTGVVATILHESRTSDFNGSAEGCQDKGGNAFGKDGQPSVVCQSLLDSANSTRPWQIAGFVAGGAFAVTWLVLQLTEPDAGSAGTTTAWTCAPSLATPGATCAVRF